MKITLTHLSKRFNYEWIFRDINYTFENNNAYAIIGLNGSGKSTLLKVVSGQLSPSEGNISYLLNNTEIAIDEIYREVCFSAPYIDLIDDFSLIEFFKFNFAFKKPINDLSIEEIVRISGLDKHRNKPIKTFSSGMRQRIKITASVLSDSAILLLDEPTTNLDQEGVHWYLNLVNDFCLQRTVLVASNMEREYTFCTHHLNMADLK